MVKARAQGGLIMTNRQWLIWQLIDMPDEEFGDAIGGVCGTGTTLWSCRDCTRHGVNKNESSDCEDKLREWLKQEHKENSND
jgi:hypothetical protein